MATAPPPVKSQPLHNFSLPFLKWGGKNHTNTTHRFRRAVSGGDSSQPSPPFADHSSEPDSESEARSHRVGSRPPRNRFGFCLGEIPHNNKQYLQQQQKPSGRISNNEIVDEAAERKQSNAEEAEVEETVQKPWNLRPRKPIGVAASKNGELQEAVTAAHSIIHSENTAQPKSLRLRGFAEMQSTERNEKRKFWIALSKEEIEEDIFAMTGSRPARRPKKRPKNVQKQIDSVFPGLWLVGVSADAYRVADTPAKR